MKSSARWLFGMFCLLIVAQSAEARRFRIFPVSGFGRGETIELVYDLPNEELFLKDGKYLDIGYFTGRSASSYVVYHGDRYRKLEDQDIAVFTAALGFDPTAKHRAQYALDHADEIAAAKAQRAHDDERIAKGQMIERQAGESTADYGRRKASFIAQHRAPTEETPALTDPPSPAKARSGSMGFAVTILLLVLIFAGRRLYAGAFKLARAVSTDATKSGERAEGAGSSHLSFEERVSMRLHELHGQDAPSPEKFAGAGAATAQYSDTLTQLNPAARAFGRKPV